MSFSKNFDSDPQTKRLASYFEELYEYLMEQGVPEDCLPSPWHVLRRVTGAINHEILREWLDSYAAVETVSEEREEEENEEFEGEGEGELPQASDPPRTRPRFRPSYLRALEPEEPKTPDLDEDQEGTP